MRKLMSFVLVLFTLCMLSAGCTPSEKAYPLASTAIELEIIGNDSYPVYKPSIQPNDTGSS